jgi:hypothetical protein
MLGEGTGTVASYKERDRRYEPQVAMSMVLPGEISTEWAAEVACPGEVARSKRPGNDGVVRLLLPGFPPIGLYGRKSGGGRTTPPALRFERRHF